MKKPISILSFGTVSLVAFTAWGAMQAVKVECNGSECQNVLFSDICGHFGTDPFAVSCDDTDAEYYTNETSCGSGMALCQDNWPPAGGQSPGWYCDDGNGNDVVVMCGTPPYSVAHKSQKIECNGNCNTVTMGEICDPRQLGALVAVGISCDDTADPGQGTNVGCGSGPTCRQWGALASTDPLGAYCQDGPGYDAVVTCGAMPVAVASIKVECAGNCMNVNLQQICASVPNHPNPVQVACDDTATPGLGTTYNPCGPSSWGDATCTTWGDIYPTDPLGAYCADGPGFDAVVTCY